MPSGCSICCSPAGDSPLYSTCLFCHQSLGDNDQVEAFPVGRRLAFDPAKGRLWVVCLSCARWNLAPLDERWEAIEQCERLFRGTRIRVSTEQIGLAKLRDGTELVRVGDPLRPEFAAWRYSSQIALRRRRNLVVAGAGIIGATALGAGALAAGLGLGAINVLRFAHGALKKRRDRRIVYRGPEAESSPITAGDLDRLVLRTSGDSSSPRTLTLELPPADARRTNWAHLDLRRTVFRGEGVVPLAGLALARQNRMAGRAPDIAAAVELIDRTGNPFHEPGALHDWTRLHRARGTAVRRPGETGEAVPVADLDTPARLALEMAAHEEQERLFLAAHLSLLEHAWREAEEIAGIADDLLLPDWIRARIGG